MPGLAAALLLTGCDGDQITAYRAPKAPAKAAAAKPAEPVAPAPASASPIAFDVPKNWRPSPTKQAMRYATFLAGPEGSPIEVAVTVFPGDTGGLIANINRWRGQINLQPISDMKQLPGTVAMENRGVRGVILDMTGRGADEEPQRMLAAALKSDANQTWFVKATAAPEAIESVKAEVVAFARSFRLPEGESGGETGGESGGETGGGASARPASKGEATWTAPAEWKANPSPSPMLLAEFTSATEAGPTRVTLSLLPGDGGGALGNINRWRGQVGLPPVSSPDQQQVLPLVVGATGDFPGFPGAMFDLTSPNAGKDGTPRQVIAMIAATDRVYFAKLTGDAPAVEKTKPQFERFVQSLRLPR